MVRRRRGQDDSRVDDQATWVQRSKEEVTSCIVCTRGLPGCMGGSVVGFIEPEWYVLCLGFWKMRRQELTFCDGTSCACSVSFPHHARPLTTHILACQSAPAALIDVIRKSWGGKPFVDMIHIHGWKHVLEQYPEIDPECAVGAGMRSSMYYP